MAKVNRTAVAVEKVILEALGIKTKAEARTEAKTPMVDDIHKMVKMAVVQTLERRLTAEVVDFRPVFFPWEAEYHQT